MATLIIEKGEKPGAYYPLGRRTTVIGRSETLMVQILDEKVSRKHMRIRYDDAGQNYTVEDMESRHGVFVNNLKISNVTVLKDGDHIAIGDTILLFTEKDFPDAESAMHHFKQVGQKQFMTLDDRQNKQQ